MLFQWFAEQGDTVKVAIITSLSAVVFGLGGALRAWASPVLRHATTSSAPPSMTVDPVIDELAGIQLQLTEIGRTLRDGGATQKEQVASILGALAHIAEEVRDVREEVRVARETRR